MAEAKVSRRLLDTGVMCQRVLNEYTEGASVYQGVEIRRSA
jgi:hypothetical protein